MKNLNNICKAVILVIAFFYGVTNANAQNPISANGKYLIGSCGDTVTLHGVNYAAFNWGFNFGEDRFPQIALTGANCVRITWYSTSAAGGGGPLYNNLAYLDSAIGKCIRNNMIAILDLHDVTCNPDTGALDILSNYYLRPDVLSIINRYHHSLILNIANEALYHNWAANPNQALINFQITYKVIITKMRNAGIQVPLMIDSPDCGTDITGLASIAESLQNYDPLHNLIFSAHTYWWNYANNDSATMRSLVTNAHNMNVPFVLAEVANYQDGNVVCNYALHYQQLLEICQELNMGWLAYGWSPDICSSRQLSTTGLFANLSPYGIDIVYNPIYGLSTHSTITTYLANNGSCSSACIDPDVPTIGASATTVCIGSPAVLSIASGALNSANRWRWYSGSCDGISIGTGTSISVTPSTNTTYYVRGDGGCITPGGECGMITIDVIDAPSPVITGFLCNGRGTLDAGNYVSYYWKRNTVYLSNVNPVSITAAGTYYVTVTGTNGCPGTASLVVTNHTKPVATITYNSPVCAGRTFTLTGGPNNMVSYRWSGPQSFAPMVQNPPSITNAQSVNAGLYYLTVTDAIGCTGTIQKSILVYANPVIAITTIPTTPTYCDGSTSVKLKVNAYSAYSWSPSPSFGQGTQTATINHGFPGTYTVTVTNTNTCTGTATYTLNSDCNIPSGLATTNLLTTSAVLRWVKPSCVINYTVRYSVHNQNAWKWIIPITPSGTIQRSISGLLRNTTYDWQIRNNCNADTSVTSGFSAIQTFSTLTRLEDEEMNSSISTFNVYPNPTTDNLTIVFSSDKEQKYTLRLIDVMGRVVIFQEHTSVIGDNQYELNLSAIPRGLYLVLLQNGNGVLERKVIVE